MSMSLALSICLLMMQLMNGAQFLIIIFFQLFLSAPCVAVFGILIVAVTSMYAPL